MLATQPWTAAIHQSMRCIVLNGVCLVQEAQRIETVSCREHFLRDTEEFDRKYDLCSGSHRSCQRELAASLEIQLLEKDVTELETG
jgi:hypothetical protein